MKDISLHIADIAENSINAGAGNLEIFLKLDGTTFTFRITDDGDGMTDAEVDAAVSPFYTTRSTRQFGFGIPFLIQNAEKCGGSVTINSRKGEGTIIEAHFELDDINCLSVGSIDQSLMQLISGNPEVNVIVRMQNNTRSFEISSVTLAAEGLKLGLPQAALEIRNLLYRGLRDTFNEFNLIPVIHTSDATNY